MLLGAILQSVIPHGGSAEHVAAGVTQAPQ